MRSTQLLRDVRLALLTLLVLIAPSQNWLAGGQTGRVSAQEGSGTRGGYLPPPPPARPRAAAATLEVRLPADAVLEIEGVRTRPSGEVRRFDSPLLEVGKRYSYTLRATWREGSKEVAHQRTVPVVAGQEVVDFRKEEPPPKNGQPPKR